MSRLLLAFALVLAAAACSQNPPPRTALVLSTCRVPGLETTALEVKVSK